MIDTVTACELLETAFTALGAGCAVDVVVREKKLQCGFAHAADGVGIGLDDHAGARSERACGDDAHTFAFDEAHTAGAKDGEHGMIANRGNVYAVIAGELENILFAVNGIGTAINNDCIFNRLSSFNCAEFACLFAGSASYADSFVDNVVVVTIAANGLNRAFTGA